MVIPSQNLALNARLLKSKVNKHAVYGVVISFAAILVATVLSAYFQYDTVTLKSFSQTQASNMGLWFLDAMPFIFAIWGQYMGTVLSYEAGAIIADQTQELRDQTDALEKKAMHGSTHDALTGLPNRVLFRDRVLQALRNAKRDKHQMGILLMDLDRFKEINDTMGHYNGDRLLKQVAMRLETLMRESDTLARLGGDEFIILLEALDTREPVTQIVHKLINQFETPINAGICEIKLGVSIGISILPDDGTSAEALVAHADEAMYAAKLAGRNGFRFYSSAAATPPGPHL